MAWNYAELSKAAKAAGGPEAFVEAIEQSGRNQMVPWIAGVGFVGVGIGICITKAKDFFKQKKAASQQAVGAAKRELIEGINRYDAEHAGQEEEGQSYEEK